MTRLIQIKILLSICTLLFANCTKSGQKFTEASTPTRRNIPIKVAIIFNFGGAQAVASEDFYFLNRDATQVWKEANLLDVQKRTVPGGRPKKIQ